MISTFKIFFDYSNFVERLQHYFNDTAPISAGIELILDKVYVVYSGNLIKYTIDTSIGVKENIAKIISECENKLYPRMIQVVEEKYFDKDFTNEQVLNYLFMGFNIDQINKMRESRHIIKRYVLTRFCTARDTVDFKEFKGEKKYRAYFRRPLVTARNTILKYARNDVTSEKQLFEYILKNATIKELKPTGENN